jgi:hypothetical protein
MLSSKQTCSKVREKETLSAMNDRRDEITSQDEQTITPPSPDTTNEPATSSRRELIERYAKVAIVAAPLLMFVSKARAIHSAPTTSSAPK